ncbi:hypothetical protein C8Q80DRAFT_93983 [Daedaleopsis nitida]|nr:hypothetical protein C8Q80DRAFT_93983 [Daedaleopsis nitida]
MPTSPVWTGIRTRRGKATQTTAIASVASESGSRPSKSIILEAHSSRMQDFVAPDPRQNAPRGPTSKRIPRRSSYLDIEQEGRHHKIYLNPSPPSSDSSRAYLKIPVRAPLQDLSPTPSSHVHWPDGALNRRGTLLVVPVAERENPGPSAPAITSMQVYRDPPPTVRSVRPKPSAHQTRQVYVNVPRYYIKHTDTVSSPLSRPRPPSPSFSDSHARSRSCSIAPDDDGTRTSRASTLSDIEPPRDRHASLSRASSRTCTPATLSDIDSPGKGQSSYSRCSSACPSDAGRRNGPPRGASEVQSALKQDVQPSMTPSRFTIVLRRLLFLLLLIVLATWLFGRHGGSSGLVRRSLHMMQLSSTS